MEREVTLPTYSVEDVENILRRKNTDPSAIDDLALGMARLSGRRPDLHQAIQQAYGGWDGRPRWFSETSSLALVTLAGQINESVREMYQT